MLTLANDEQRGEFFKHKRAENESNGYTYPNITFTLSESDTKQRI